MGNNIDLDPVYVNIGQGIEDYKIDVKTKRTHPKIESNSSITFVEEKFPAYFEAGVWALSDDGIEDTGNYFW